jgi:RimJ/RimL family protein N-acetyltransferase
VGAVAVYLVFAIVKANQAVASPFVGPVDKRTERLALRRAMPSDVDAYADSLDPVFMAANGWTDRHRERALKFFGHPRSRGRRPYLVAYDPVTDDQVVFLAVNRTKLYGCRWAVSAGARPRYRGEGLTTEALSGLFALLAELDALPGLVGTSVDNEPMQRAATGAGAVEVARSRRRLADRTVVDAIWYRYPQ